MSLETWKAEFYHVGAEDCPVAEAASHSLRKWEGLSKTNLKKHGCKMGYKFIEDKIGFTLDIDTTTCALCKHHYDFDSENDSSGCEECPIHKSTGANCHGEYTEWMNEGKVVPMVKLLKRTVEFVKNQGISTETKEGT